MSFFDCFQNASNKPRAPMQFIYDTLNGSFCMSYNPFMRPIQRDDLLVVLNRFSFDILEAANDLAYKSNTALFDNELTENKVTETAEILTAIPSESEANLIAMFQQCWGATAHSLEKIQKAPESKVAAKEAMESLCQLYVVVRAAPKVYDLVPKNIAANFMFRSQEMHA